MLHQGWSLPINVCSMHVRHALILKDTAIRSQTDIRDCELCVNSAIVRHDRLRRFVFIDNR